MRRAALAERRRGSGTGVRLIPNNIIMITDISSILGIVLGVVLVVSDLDDNVFDRMDGRGCISLGLGLGLGLSVGGGLELEETLKRPLGLAPVHS